MLMQRCPPDIRRWLSNQSHLPPSCSSRLHFTRLLRDGGFGVESFEPVWPGKSGKGMAGWEGQNGGQMVQSKVQLDKTQYAAARCNTWCEYVRSTGCYEYKHIICPQT